MSKHTDASLFAMDDFRAYLRAWAAARGRGEYRRISKSLNIHTTLMSQILNGRKCLTEEQALKLCNLMALSALETDYFLKLVQAERAGTEDLKRYYLRHLQQLKRSSTEVRSRVPEAKDLSHEDRAIFYSSWQFSMVRLLTSVEHFQTPIQISARLNLSVSRVQEILDFLVSRGLCVEARGRYSRTQKNTHVEAGSSLASRHHQNWRGRSLDMLEHISSEDLAFTAPICLSAKDLAKVRAILIEAITNIAKLVETSPSEEFSYLGIDWIKM